MKTCPQCGFHHVDLDERCTRCGAVLDSISSTVNRENPDDLPHEKFKFTGGEIPGWRLNLPSRLLAIFRRRTYLIGRALSCELPTSVHSRNPWTAGALSLIPGLGQLYNHQPKKCLYFLALQAVWLTLVVATFYKWYSNWIIDGYFLLAALAFNDGLVTAKKINRDYFIWQHGVAFYCAWILYLTLAYFLLHYLGTQRFFYQFRVVQDEMLDPAVHRGERIIINRAFIGTPRLGDVIVYRPPENIKVSVRMGEHFDAKLKLDEIYTCIVGLPGDTVERRGGVFLRNGRPIPSSRLLVNSLADIPPDIKLTAPPDRYVVLLKRNGTFINYWGERSWYDIENWEEACLVPRRAILGRVVCVFDPPPQRRFLRRKEVEP